MMHRLPRVAAMLALAGCVSPTTEPPPASRLVGRVVDALGRPLPGVPVRIYGGIATRWQTGATTTDDGGRFTFTNPAGVLMAQPNRPQPATHVGVCAGETADNANPAAYLPWQDVTIPAGETVQVELLLDRTEVARRLAELRAR